MATITMRITPHINTFTKYVIGISTDLPGIGGTGIMIVIGGIRVVDGGITATFAVVETTCSVMASAIVISIACINGIVVPSGPITGTAEYKSPAKTNNPTPINN
jgi:hypothetical protein